MSLTPKEDNQMLTFLRSKIHIDFQTTFHSIYFSLFCPLLSYTGTLLKSGGPQTLPEMRDPKSKICIRYQEVLSEMTSLDSRSELWDEQKQIRRIFGASF